MVTLVWRHRYKIAKRWRSVYHKIQVTNDWHKPACKQEWSGKQLKRSVGSGNGSSTGTKRSRFPIQSTLTSLYWCIFTRMGGEVWIKTAGTLALTRSVCCFWWCPNISQASTQIKPRCRGIQTCKFTVGIIRWSIMGLVLESWDRNCSRLRSSKGRTVNT